jgi:hypothetical protein
MDAKSPRSFAPPADGLTYDPRAKDMKHDEVFAAHAPGIADSGNLKHQWGPEGDHTRLGEPPNDEESE